MTVKIYRDPDANAVFIENSNGVQFLNTLQATMEDPSDTTVNIVDLSKGIELFSQASHEEFVDKDGNSYGATAVDVCNALNAQFAAAGSSTGDAPAITSSTTVNLTQGDTLNYELIATNGVGYEWSNLPSGVATVDGNVRKLIGGSSLAVGTYNITVKAINYFGEDTETISLVVSAPPYSNTKSVQFISQDYLGANAALLDAELGRSGNGSGSGDAWTIAFWFKGGTSTSGQTIFYYGSNDVTNGGHMEVRFVGGTDKIRLRYGTGVNYLQLVTPSNSCPANTWKHVVVTYDGGTTGASSTDLSDYYSRFSIYIDGVSQTLSTNHSNYGYTGAISGDNLRVGRFASGNYLNSAKVDELAIWDSDQSANISDLYNSGTTHDLEQLTTAPNHYWRMGDGDTYPNIQDQTGTATFVMYNMTASDIVTDAP